MTATETRDGITINYVGPDEDTPAAFIDWLARPHHAIGFDVEAGGTDPLDHFAPGFHTRLVAFADEHQAWVLHGDRKADIETVLKTRTIFAAHNAPYDVLATKHSYGIAPRAVIDTFLLALMVYPPAGSRDDIFADEDDDEAAVLMAEDRHKLKPLSAMTGSNALVHAEDALLGRFAEILGPRPRGSDSAAEVKQWMGRGYSTLDVSDPVYWVYNGLDAVFGLRVLRWLLAQWSGTSGVIRRLLANESRLGLMLAGIPWRGLRVDRDALSRVFFSCVAAQNELIPAFAELGVTKPASTPEMDAALKALGVVDPVISDAGNISTDKRRGLPRLREPDQPEAVRQLADLLTQWRGHQAVRMKTREIERIAVRSVDGRVHPSVNALKARTGRMSISRPALQNIPKRDTRIRSVFLAEEGHVLVSADFSQVEYRVAAALSRDPAMTEVFRAGADLHDNTATQLFGPGFTAQQRDISKNSGFAVLYGAGPRKFAAMTGLSLDKAEQVMEGLFETYSQLRSFVAKTQRDTEVVALSGRRTAIDPDKAYASTNYYVQGTARDLFADALLRLRSAGWGDALWLVIHDEIVLQVAEHLAEDACVALERAMTFTFRGVPITAQAKVLGSRWSQLPQAQALELAL